ncbi:Vsb1 protein [Martiniozyma asiatica (nom. inval.)]|nr:Vsb1 protein [Martiniozyma asiatica]
MPTLVTAISISNAHANSNSNSNSNPNSRQSSNALGRSFIYSSYKPGSPSIMNSVVHSTGSIHEESADLANVGLTDFENDDNEEALFGEASESDAQFEQQVPNSDNNTLLINELPNSNLSRPNYGSIPLHEQLPMGIHIDVESLKPKRQKFSIKQKFEDIKSTPSSSIINECFKKPVSYLPAVFLGTLLNVLDALSYGMIMFPIGETVFSNMGPVGLSMFYISTILSQLIYSLGGSAFKNAIGSEMIEITPFFHQMAINIMVKLQRSNVNDPLLNEKILTTTIFTFVISSIITGITFGILGKCKLGKLVGFFPRHILVGCIGGVGYFLFITAIEVSSRIEGGFEYNFKTLKFLMEPLTFLQWTIPLILTLVLISIQKFISNSSLIVPLYFILIFILFHLLIWIVPNWNLTIARDFGWIFNLDNSSSNEPWYQFYHYYDFNLCQWWLIIDELPTMLALTFFGILHVPINVPALALSIGMDEFDVDRELIAHGLSNFISGIFGSIQNYLVYTNSVLFIKAGADSRLSGVMLAIATFLILLIGPVLIEFIPVCVVGSLIYLLGFELLKESVWDTIGRLKKFEYFTIILIIISMGIFDFVIGILIGILLACLSFVVDAGRKRVIDKIYTGDFAKSIIIRHPKQQEFLKDVGKQICILKLNGSIFFGSIGRLEEEIKELFIENVNVNILPIKYLILDLNNVLTIDFSAAEGFKRIRNYLFKKNCFLLISSVENKSSIVESLNFCGLWDCPEKFQEMIQMFNNLNSALEWCENKFLQNYKDLFIQRQQQALQIQQRKKSILNGSGVAGVDSLSPIIGTPRHVNFMNAFKKQMDHDQTHQIDEHLNMSSSSTVNANANAHACNGKKMLNQPLDLILQIMNGLSNTNNKQLWKGLVRYIYKVHYKRDELIYEKFNHQPSLFFFEDGLINYEISMKDLNFKISSSELPLTMFGDIIIGKSDRNIKYFANNDCTIWILDSKSLNQMKSENKDLYQELLSVCIRLNTQRSELISSNIIIS